MRAPQVDVAGLGRRVEIGRGGQGAVYALPDYRRGWHRHMVYKEYHPEIRAELDVVALDRVVDFASRISRPPSDRRGTWLLERTAWPIAIVIGSATVCGVLMRRIPDAFTLDIAVGGRVRHRPAGVEYLLNPPAYVARLGLHITRRQRIGLLAGLAGTLRTLHGAAAVIGDLSPRNVLFSPESPTHTFLLDCDTATVDGAAALPRMETPDWAAPGHPDRPGSWPDDVHKFALLAIRMLTGDQTASDPAVPAVASLGLTELADGSLRTDPTKRPTMAEWSDALDALLRSGRPAASPGRWKRRSLLLAGTGLAVIGSMYGVALARPDGDGLEPDRTESTCDAGWDVPAAAPYRGAIDVTAVADDPRTPAVAALLDAYFTAIAANRPDDASVLFDPANRLNPVTPQRRRAFAEAVAGHVDSGIRLLRLRPTSPSPGPLTVYLTHVSTPRSPSHAGAPSACWRGTYTLALSSCGYRITSIRRLPGRCPR